MKDVDKFYGKVVSSSDSNFEQLHDSLQDDFADGLDYMGKIEKPKRNEIVCALSGSSRNFSLFFLYYIPAFQLSELCNELLIGCVA